MLLLFQFGSFYIHYSKIRYFVSILRNNLCEYRKFLIKEYTSSKVQISRSVFELIYGGPFDVKERGQIELKKTKAVTYLVEGMTEN